MKKIITLLLVVFAFASCSSDDDDKIQNPVIGTWKLVKIANLVYSENGGNYAFTDYSTQNRIYKFDSKSNLTITEGTTVQTYKYEYKVDYLSGDGTTGETKTPIVVIEGLKYGYLFINGQMKLERSYVDGEDLYLEKQ
jgi:hypothetical protein